jgi:hypothetical protein
MKFAFAFAGLALLAAPASAEVVHRTTVDHGGSTVTVTYEPRAETSLRNASVGPRYSPVCHWKTTIAVERSALAGDGSRIAALARTLDTAETRGGMAFGHCHTLSSRGEVGRADEAALRAAAADAASRDAPAIRAELASLAGPGAAPAHAR